MIEQVVVMPRWSGTPESDWYPWLRAELAGWHGEVTVLDLPERDAPRIEPCIEAIASAVSDDAMPGTLLIGHSVGCQAMVRFLATRTEGIRAAGLLCVAGWWAVDAPWPSIVPWIETPVDADAARAAAGPVTVLLGGGDPFTSDQKANGARWRARLGAEVIHVAGAKHFNETTAPAVGAVLRERYGVG